MRTKKTSATTAFPLLSIGFFLLLLAVTLSACGGDSAELSPRGEPAARTGDTGTATSPAEPAYPGEVADPMPTEEPPMVPESDTEAVPPEPGVPPPLEAVRVYLVDLEAGAAEDDGEPAADSFGCGDRLRAVEMPVATEGLDTAARIAAALGSLVESDGGEEVPGDLYNVFERSELTVERVEAVPGVPGAFRVHLAGQLVLGGVCDHPRVRAQLEATARQFEGVEEVEVLLAGRPIDAFLTGRG